MLPETPATFISEEIEWQAIGADQNKVLCTFSEAHILKRRKAKQNKNLFSPSESKLKSKWIYYSLLWKSKYNLKYSQDFIEHIEHLFNQTLMMEASCFIHIDFAVDFVSWICAFHF